MDERSGAEEVAYAKINLALHVRGREADGYHRIETLFAFAEEGDRLSVEPGNGLTLQIEGPFAGGLSDEGDNLVLRAARALADAAGVRDGASLMLQKNLPVASGIGGGSADAAATLRALNRFWGIGFGLAELGEIGRKLGADVPACLLSRTAIGTGRGDRLERVDPPGLEAMPVLLVNPGVSLSTARVFGGWDGRDRGPMPEDWRSGRNDLEAPAIAHVPPIASVIEDLKASEGAMLARMSGSGATCFALFESEAARDRSAAAIRASNPSWWHLSSRIR